MNPAICVTLPQGLGAMSVGEMLALPGVISEGPSKSDRLSVSTQELFRNVAETLDAFVVRTIEKRTQVEFNAAFQQVFPKYFEGMLGLSLLARTIVPNHVREVLSREYFGELEAEFRDHALAAFGSEVRDQAIFTVWTLRKISDICRRISEAPPLAGNLEKDDLQLFENFAWHSMRTRFHLDCLLKSMRLKTPIYPDVLGAIIDGLRSAVDAYAWARSALDLRVPVSEPEIGNVVWDEEDQDLVNESMRDMLAEPI